jgi:CheY-like chemotaxis protein
VAFPASDKKVVKEETVHPDADWRGSGKVLVVEDEESARELASIVLKRTGFEVLEAKDGLEGVEVFRENRSDIRCVLLDLAMPNMDGDEAHREIRKISAEVPTILCSGYPEQDAVSRFSDLNPSGFIEKPYNPETLIARVREAVEGQGNT